MIITELRTRLIVISIAILGCIIPLLGYWLFFGNLNLITPQDAKKLLLNDSLTVLVDVRTESQYKQAHIDGAVNWPMDDILTVSSDKQFPEFIAGKDLVLIDDAGLGYSELSDRIAIITSQKVYFVRGGMQEWIGSVDRPDGGVYDRFMSGDGQVRSFNQRNSPIYEQLAAVVSGFGVKLTYTLLSLVIAVILWRSQAADLRALCRAMIFFFIGENCCAINYFVFTEKSYFFEYLHSYGMLLAFSLAAYALIEGIDYRIIMFSSADKKCAVLPLCKRCVKYDKLPCNLRRIFQLVILASFVLAFMPLVASMHDTSYNTTIFGTYYNYNHRVIYQLFEMYFCPASAMVMLAFAFIASCLADKTMTWCKVFFAASAGPLGFGLFRSINLGLYSRNLVWFNFWEEITEFIFILGVCIILWLFRNSLLRSPAYQTGAEVDQ